MDPMPRSRLGTQPPEFTESARESGQFDSDTPGTPEEPTLGLSVRLDRPFHELKEFLLAEFERAYVTRCLSESEMNVSQASRSSGLSRKHLRTLMSKYGIQRTAGDSCEPDPIEE
jgi:DNA-binding NtrC family response regulator